MPDLCTTACSELGGAWGAIFGVIGLAFAAYQRRAREQLRTEKDAIITRLSGRPPPTVVNLPPGSVFSVPPTPERVSPIPVVITHTSQPVTCPSCKVRFADAVAYTNHDCSGNG